MLYWFGEINFLLLLLPHFSVGETSVIHEHGQRESLRMYAGDVVWLASKDCIGWDGGGSDMVLAAWRQVPVGSLTPRDSVAHWIELSTAYVVRLDAVRPPQRTISWSQSSTTNCTNLQIYTPVSHWNVSPVKNPPRGEIITALVCLSPY